MRSASGNSKSVAAVLHTVTVAARRLADSGTVDDIVPLAGDCAAPQRQGRLLGHPGHGDGLLGLLGRPGASFRARLGPRCR